MATPLSATGRIVLPYTVDGQVHQWHAYVRNPTVTGSTYNINTRTTDSNDLDWLAAADGMAATLSKFVSSATAFGSALLQLRSGSVFNTVAAKTVTNGSAVSGYNKASQLSIVMRDTLFRKVKVILLEGIFSPPFHAPGYPTGDTGVDGLVKEFTSAHTVTAAPYIWLVGRGNGYLNTSPVLGVTIALNRKVRRNRGLA